MCTFPAAAETQKDVSAVRASASAAGTGYMAGCMGVMLGNGTQVG